jgi:hypothetical protein
MEYALSNDENIYGILRLFINEPSICKNIIKYKKYLEEKETLDYHFKRWEDIAGSHYILHDTHEGKFSYIFNEEDYIVKPDHKLIFFNLTGISYQVIELLHELIKINRICSENTHIEDYKYWINYDDKLYAILSKKIMFKMKKNITY